MQNGYFQLVKAPGGFGIKLIPPVDGGEDIRLEELLHYLDKKFVKYDLAVLKKAVTEKKEQVCFLGMGECPNVAESYNLNVSGDYMSAVIRFFPASETGERITFESILKDLRHHNVIAGVQMQLLQDHFMSNGTYCTDMLVAKGKEPVHAEDDKIVYSFNTDVHAQPEQREDGTVDYFNLNLINHCKKGEVLAKIIRGEKGKEGVNVLGKRIPPREAKKAVLKHGKNIQLSEDRMSLTSLVDGHVMLVDGNVFVSDIFEVENVDTSTGNIEYSGSVQASIFGCF